MAFSGRLTGGQRAQLIRHCSDHHVGRCDTCRLDLALSDLFAQLGGSESQLCPRCGENVVSVLTAHINTCCFITAGMPARAPDNGGAPDDSMRDTPDTASVPEYALVRQLFRSRRPNRKRVVCRLSTMAACVAVLAGIPLAAQLSRSAIEWIQDRHDSGAPVTLASIRVPSIVNKPHGNAAPPAPGTPVYGSGEAPRPNATTSSIRETASTVRTVVSQVWDRADGPEDARPILPGLGPNPLSTAAARTAQIRPVATVSRTAPRNAPVIMTSTPTSASVRPMACLFTDRLAWDLRKACDYLARLTQALEGVGEAAGQGAATVMTSITEAMAQVPIDRLRPDRVKQFIEDLPGAPDAVRRAAALPESRESP
jgi:hypothetical protein